MIDLLSECAEFCRGEWVPFSVQRFLRVLPVSKRTLQRALKVIEKYSLGVRVARKATGIEWQLVAPRVPVEGGDSLRRRGGDSLRPEGGDRSRDPDLRNSEDLRAKFKISLGKTVETAREVSPPEVSPPPSTALLAGLETVMSQCRALIRHCQALAEQAAKAVRPVPTPGLAKPSPVECPLTHSATELDAIIRQHQRLTDPSLLRRPIYAEERQVVDAAFATAGLQSPSERLALAAEVSALAASDAGRGRQARATLRYAFEAPHFLTRLARLRETRERHKREQADIDLTRALRPLVQARPRPLDPCEVQRNIARAQAALDGPSPWARAAGGSP